VIFVDKATKEFSERPITVSLPKRDASLLDLKSILQPITKWNLYCFYSYNYTYFDLSFFYRFIYHWEYRLEHRVIKVSGEGNCTTLSPDSSQPQRGPLSPIFTMYLYIYIYITFILNLFTFSRLSLRIGIRYSYYLRLKLSSSKTSCFVNLLSSCVSSYDLF
jgi:hypothetical protein